MVTPAWPPGAAPNGIVTYTSHLAPAFRQRGTRTVLLAWDVPKGTCSNGATTDDGDLVDIAEFQPGRSLFGKMAARVPTAVPGIGLWRCEVHHDRAGRPGRTCPVPHRSCSRSKRHSAWPAAVIKLKRIPVVTRLHGPWFLNGEVLGEKKDAAFTSASKQERLSIAWADGSRLLRRTSSTARGPITACRSRGPA